MLAPNTLKILTVFWPGRRFHRSGHTSCPEMGGFMAKPRTPRRTHPARQNTETARRLSYDQGLSLLADQDEVQDSVFGVAGGEGIRQMAADER